MYCGAGQFEPAETRGHGTIEGIGGYQGEVRIPGEARGNPLQRSDNPNDNGHRDADHRDRHGKTETEIDNGSV